jgi:hypothetical protein
MTAMGHKQTQNPRVNGEAEHKLVALHLAAAQLKVSASDFHDDAIISVSMVAGTDAFLPGFGNSCSLIIGRERNPNTAVVEDRVIRAVGSI